MDRVESLSYLEGGKKKRLQGVKREKGGGNQLPLFCIRKGRRIATVGRSAGEKERRRRGNLFTAFVLS